MKKVRTLILAAGLVIGAGTAAQAEEPNIFWIKALPFVKAAAYAEAIDDFCFAETRYHLDSFEGDIFHDARHRLQYLALKQSEQGRVAFSGVFVEDDKAIREDADRKASAHLMNNYAACAPAIAFVEKTIGLIPELEPKLQEMAKVLDANRKAAKDGKSAVAAEAPNIDALTKLKSELGDSQVP